jgi:hypothetical protein
MKRVFLVIIVSTLLVTLGFGQTPGAGSNTDPANVKGCLGGSDGNYTVAEDGTRQIFKITTSTVDLKPHLGHDVKLTGQKASSPVSSGIADNSFAVTELIMISEHCAAAAAAPTSATVSTPAADAPPPAATVNSSAATASTPAADAPHPARLSAHPRRLSATKAADAALPATKVSPSSDTVVPSAADPATSAVTASSSSQTVSAPAAAATTTTVTHKGRSLWLLIAFTALVIVLGTLAPLLGRWRKRKILERTGTPNLSLTNEVSPEGAKQEPRKAA